jgi:signal transduction histidine kinase
MPFFGSVRQIFTDGAIAVDEPGAHYREMATSSIVHGAELSSPYLVSMTPETPSSVTDVVRALRTITPLAGLSDAEYEWLARHGKERVGDTGTLIFREAEPATSMVMLLRGEVHVRRRTSGPMALFIGRAGQMTGKLPFSRMKTYGGDGYANGPLWLLEIHESLFPAMLEAIPSMGQRSVTVLLDRVREVTRMEQQAEKLSALGKLSANLAHELNNPASAAQRSAASLFGELRAYGDKKYALGAICLSTETAEKLQRWNVTVRSEMATYLSHEPGETASPLDAADREAKILAWLEEHGVPRAWEIAPQIAETRFPLCKLDEFAREFPDEVLAPAMATFASALRVEKMAETIVSSTVRIFDLISAIKDYSYMDQAPIQEVDLPSSLEATLSMVGSRLSGIEVAMDFDAALGPVSAYGGELNQVWIALIENAIEAMPQGGKLRLKTKLQGQMAMVEVWDSGVGIPAELQSRVFEPFFTTKAPGKGLGLGLDTAQRIVTRHSGFVRVESKPGATCFQVRIPVDQAQAY